MIQEHRAKILSIKLEQAGYPLNGLPQFLSLQLLLTFAFPLFGYFFVPLWLNSKIRKRKMRLLGHLPFYLDLLTLMLEVGLEFTCAVEELIENDRENALRDEMRQTLSTIQLGMPRGKAFVELGRRTGVEALQQLASSIQQSEELGSSLGPLLRLQSEMIRRAIFAAAEERAQKIPLKILAPLMGLIFPVLMILLLAPICFRLFSEG